MEGLQLPMGAGGCSPILEKKCCFFFRVFFLGEIGGVPEREGSPPFFGPNTLFIEEYHW